MNIRCIGDCQCLQAVFMNEMLEKYLNAQVNNKVNVSQHNCICTCMCVFVCDTVSMCPEVLLPMIINHQILFMFYCKTYL